MRARVIQRCIRECHELAITCKIEVGIDIRYEVEARLKISASYLDELVLVAKVLGT